MIEINDIDWDNIIQYTSRRLYSIEPQIESANLDSIWVASEFRLIQTIRTRIYFQTAQIRIKKRIENRQCLE